MKVKAFKTLRPPTELAKEVASLPYDVGSIEDARVLADANEKSFLHVERPEVDLPETFDLDSGIDHETAAKNLKKFIDQGWLIKDDEPCLYVYRIALGKQTQTGIVACCHIEDYENNIIRKHEKTKKPVEDRRTAHVQTTGAHTGPIFLLIKDQKDIMRLMNETAAGEPMTDFTAVDGIRHTVWKVADPSELEAAFSAVPLAYVADGHHRTAAACRAGMERREANPNHTGDEEYNWFLATIFPASELNVIAYNRVVHDLNGLDKDAFLAKAGEAFELSETDAEAPSEPGTICMYVDGKWYALTWQPPTDADPVSSMDVSGLQSRLLEPVLGIDDPRTSDRIDYHGGFDSIQKMKKKVDTGKAAVAFSVFPTSCEQLMAIADADQIMPPKSTWFEPKLRSGLFVHLLD